MIALQTETKVRFAGETQNFGPIGYPFLPKPGQKPLLTVRHYVRRTQVTEQDAANIREMLRASDIFAGMRV